MSSLDRNIADAAQSRNRTIGMMREILNGASGRPLTDAEDRLFRMLEQRFQERTEALEHLRAVERELQPKPSRIDRLIAEIRATRAA